MKSTSIRKTLSALAAIAAFFVATSASAALLATNDFEEAAVADLTGFTAAGDELLADIVGLAGYDNDKPSGAYTTEPWPFSSANFGSQYLSVDSGTNMVWRSLDSSSKVYFDSYMKFAPTTGDVEYPDGSKFVIYLDAATSNLCVVSGTDANTRTPVTNRLTATVLPDTWGRLTVSAESDDDVFSFQVRLNGNLLATAGSTSTFYSLASGATISQVGFKGTGAVDDMVVRTSDPFGTAASINGETFASLEAAIDAAGPGSTVVLQADSSENVTLASVGISLDTNGKSYSGTISGASGVGILEENGVYTSIANTASTWTGLAGDSLWENAQNWSTKSVPTSATTVTFTNDTTVGIPYSGTSAYGLVVSEDVRVSIRNSNLSSYYWSTLTVGEGHVTGGGTIKLCGAGFSTSVSGLTINVNMEIGNANGYDGFLNQTGSGSYIVNGTLSCGEQGAYMTIPSAVTFNNAVTVSSGVNVKISNASVVLGDGASLDGTGEITFNAVEPSDSMKTALQNADKWTGVCELRNVGSNGTSIDAANYGNINSTVRFNGMTGYLRFSSGSVTDVGNVKRIDLTGNGLNLVNSFSSGTYGYRITAELSGNGPFKAGTCHYGGAYGAGKYIITGTTTNFTGAVNFGDTTSYRAVVVFATDAEYSAGTIPSPTDHGEIIVTAGRTGAMAVTAGAEWNGYGGFIINGTVNVASGGSLSTHSNGKKVQGSGTINYEALPTAGNPSTTTIPYFSDEWTGAVILPAANITQKTGIPLVGLSSANGRIVVKGFTRSANDLSIHLNTGTAQIKGTLQLDGDLYITDANSNATYTWNKVTGSGNMTVTKSTGTANGVTHAITTLDDYTGTLETKTFSLTIGTVNVSTLDLTVGDPIVKLAGGCNLTTDPENIAVKVGDVATSHKLFKASDGNLYVKVASVTVNDVTTYYPTLQAAANAAIEAGGTTVQFARIDSEAGTSLSGWTYEEGVFTLIRAYNATTETEYATLAAAVAEASAGDTIKLVYNNSETAVDTTGKDFIFDENGYAFSGTWTGSGRIVLKSAPSTTTWSSALFVTEGWIGTVTLDWGTIDYRDDSVSPKRGDIAGIVNKYGIAASTVEIGENSKTEGNCYFNGDTTPKLKVSGYLFINDGSSGTKRTIGNVCGDGVFVFGNKANTVNYGITNLNDWNGILTNMSANVTVGTITRGNGVVYCSNKPSSAPTFTTSEGNCWTGRFIADWSSYDNPFNLHNYGIEGSIVEVTKTFSGYFDTSAGDVTISPTIDVSGSITINNGYSGKIVTLTKVIGSGTLTFNCIYTHNITTLQNWDGVLTYLSPGSISKIESGSGKVVSSNRSFTPTIGADWSGSFVMNWTPSYSSTAANTAWVLDNYGVSGSTVVIAQAIEHGYLKDKSSATAPSIAPAVYLKANLTVDNGFYNATTTFSQLGADEGVVFKTRSSGDGTPYAVTLLKDFAGSFNLQYGSRLTINTIERNALPSAGDLVVAATAQTGTSTPASFNVASTKIRVAGVDTVVPLAYSTSVAVDESGLYKAVARIGSNYYATFQDALTARGSGSGDITVLDDTAPIPEGYRIVDGKLVRKPAGAIINIF